MPTNKTNIGKQICVSCKKEKPYDNFYISSSEMFSLTRRVPMCKSCMLEKCINEQGEFDLNLLNEVLRQIDKPFILRLWQSAINEAETERGIERSKKAFSNYFKNINSLKQYKKMTFKDSDNLNKRFRIEDSGEQSLVIAQRENDMNEIVNMSYDKNFKVTKVMVELFGDGYSVSMYKKMYEKYEKLKINYTLQTNLHQEALATYVRFKVQEELATARGDVADAKKWYDAAIDAADKAKLTPKQLTKADLQSGVNSICELTKALEQAVDVINIMPQFKYRPNDAPDFNIYCYVNYERELNEQAPVEYGDIYSFYDRKKKEYITQNGDPYGIFVNDPTEKNRETVKTFIKLPDDYDDLAGDKDDE